MDTFFLFTIRLLWPFGCSRVHVPWSCSLSVVSSQSRRAVCASINKSNWHLVAFTIIIIIFMLQLLLLCWWQTRHCVCLYRRSNARVAFSRMSHINYSTGNFLTPVFLSLLLPSWLFSKLSERRIHLCRAAIDGRPPLQDFRINTACWAGGCWVDRKMFHVCNSHASCHKSIGRAR